MDRGEVDSWNGQEVLQDLQEMLEDYSVRSKDPADTRLVFASSMFWAEVGSEGVLVVLVCDDTRLVGYFIWTVVDNPFMGEKYVSPLQGYVKPGGPKLAQVARHVEPVVRQWARKFGARRMVHATYRHGRGYEKVMSKIGFHKIAEVYEKYFTEEVEYAVQGEQAGGGHLPAGQPD